MFVVSGKILLPDKRSLLPEDSVIHITLQDTSEPIEENIAKLTMNVGSTCFPDALVPFSLSYVDGKLQARNNDWYTLRIRIETPEGNLICFNNQITRAIDKNGRPRTNLMVRTIAVGTYGETPERYQI
jgi:uncharacterized lipoprotein YbaY